jgi:hypothetical protein
MTLTDETHMPDQRTTIDESARVTPLPMGLDEFWRVAARERLTAQFALSQEMQLVEQIGIDAVRQILFQYRYFTLAFTTDISILIGRCPPSSLRTLLGALLHDELGRGNPELAHPALYDRFLVSLGAIRAAEADATLDDRMSDDVRVILADLHRNTCDAGLSYAIGLRGMGGECVCGVYFVELYRRIVRHPSIMSRFAEIDWTFWDIHAGHADAEHDVATRAAVAAFAAEGRLDIAQLAAGYEHGIASWNRFWRGLYRTYVAPTHVGATTG